MRTMRTRYLGLALVLCSAAPTVAAQGTRDSAGTRIIENTEPVWTAGQEWRLSERPILVVGDAPGGDGHLGRIVGTTRLSDGRVVIADQTTRQLNFHDPSGRRLQSVSGTGPDLQTGPRRRVPTLDEIRRLPGDSIAVESGGVAWIFTPDGTLSRTVQFAPPAAGTLQGPFLLALGRFDDGTAVAADYPQGRRGPAGARQWVDSASLFLIGRTGEVVRPLSSVPIVVFTGGSNGPRPMDMGPQGVWASSGRAFYWGFPEEYAIRVYDTDWTLQRIIRRSWAARRFTDADRASYVDGWMQMWSKATGAEREAERKEMLESAYPELIPAYSDLLATPAGELWVREPDLTGAPGCWCFAGLSTVPSRWSVFDDGGRWLGEVAMPPRFIPLEIGADYVLGRSRESDDVPRVVMYRLEKP
jgi:hypothetical protein